MTVLTTPTQIEGARLLTLRAMLKLELLGPEEDFDGLVTSLEDYAEGY